MVLLGGSSLHVLRLSFVRTDHDHDQGGGEHDGWELQMVASIDLNHHRSSCCSPIGCTIAVPEIELTWIDGLLLINYLASSLLKVVFVAAIPKAADSSSSSKSSSRSSSSIGYHLECCTIDLSGFIGRSAVVVGFDSCSGMLSMLTREGDVRSISLVQCDPIMAPMLLLHKQHMLMMNADDRGRDNINNNNYQGNNNSALVGPRAEQLRRFILCSEQ
jgi:hypothetical protein